MDRLTTLIAQARQVGLTLSTDGEHLTIRGPRTAETLARALLARKPEVLAFLAQAEPEVQWRVVAFQERIPAKGPIWPPKIRNSPYTDSEGYCSLCGDALTTDSPARRCPPCVRALWLALNMQREGGAIEPPPVNNTPQRGQGDAGQASGSAA